MKQPSMRVDIRGAGGTRRWRISSDFHGSFRGWSLGGWKDGQQTSARNNDRFSYQITGHFKGPSNDHHISEIKVTECRDPFLDQAISSIRPSNLIGFFEPNRNSNKSSFLDDSSSHPERNKLSPPTTKEIREDRTGQCLPWSPVASEHQTHHRKKSAMISTNQCAPRSIVSAKIRTDRCLPRSFVSAKISTHPPRSRPGNPLSSDRSSCPSSD